MKAEVFARHAELLSTPARHRGMPMIVMLPDHLKPGPEDPPPPEWDKFAHQLLERWHALLASDPDERQVQDFLERYPCLLPRPYRLFSGGHHGPYPAAVISQPVLPSYQSRRPDFMWLSADSMNEWIVLIEIERPGKKWFTKAGIPSASLTQSLDQLRDWKRWFQEPHNVQAFLEYYAVPRSQHRVLACHYVLIYGRRAEAIHGEGRKKRPSMQKSDETLMTLDRLSPDRELDYILTVKRESEVYRALHVQPSIELHRPAVSDWQDVQGVAEAISANPEIDAKRKVYLLNTLAKWWEQLELERSRTGL